MTEDITEPRNDGTRGSALYSIPFKLNRTPSPLWADIFLKTWDSPPTFTTSHRPGIARVSGDRIILDGTTLDEVKETHKKTLELCVSEANRIEKEKEKHEQKQKKKMKERSDQFRKEVENKSKDIEFE